MSSRLWRASRQQGGLLTLMVGLVGAGSSAAGAAHPTVQLSRTGQQSSSPPVLLLRPQEVRLESAQSEVADPLPPLGRPSGRTSVSDPVRQFGLPAASMPTPLLNFEGMGTDFTAWKDFATCTFSPFLRPPDTNGAVGPNDYVQAVNSNLAFFDKRGHVRACPILIRRLWTGFGGPCENGTGVDPIVLYDQLADRWLVAELAFLTSGSNLQVPQLRECVAVSKTGDPMGGYALYSFEFQRFPDYGKFAVWPDGYYATFQSLSERQQSLGSIVCAYDRAHMLLGVEQAASQCFQLKPGFSGLLPTSLEGSRLPAAGMPDVIAGFTASPRSALQLWRFHVDWANPAHTALVRQPDLPVATINVPCPLDHTASCVPQANTQCRLDTLGDRVMFPVTYRNFGDHQSLVLNHTVATGPPVPGVNTGVRWYEIRNPGGTPTVSQQGTFAPDSLHRWMGSLAQDEAGNLALGFALSSELTSPAVAYAGRLATDSPGTLPQGEQILVASQVSQMNSSRWGDYSGMAVDPSDGCTFWFTTGYVPNPGLWNTRIGTFRFPSCSGAANDFSMTVSPLLQLAASGGAPVTYTVSTAVRSGAAEPIALSASNLPPGVSARFDPETVVAGGSATLTLATARGAPPVTYAAFNVLGASRSASRAAIANVTIANAAVPVAARSPP